MKICVDSRERKKIPKFKEYVTSGKTKIIDEIEVVTSQVGDAYSSDGLVGIERKSEDDFLPSIYNKQIEKQLRELRDNFTYPFLFIEYEGIMDIIQKHPKINPEMIVGEIASIMARQKVTVCFVSDFYVPIVCKMIDKFYDGNTIIKDQEYTPIRRGSTIKELKLDLITRIPGIKAQKGIKLLEHFNYSISKIASAESDDFMNIAGIGKTTSQKIKEIFK